MTYRYDRNWWKVSLVQKPKACVILDAANLVYHAVCNFGARFGAQICITHLACSERTTSLRRTWHWFDFRCAQNEYRQVYQDGCSKVRLAGCRSLPFPLSEFGKFLYKGEGEGMQQHRQRCFCSKQDLLNIRIAPCISCFQRLFKTWANLGVLTRISRFGIHQTSQVAQATAHFKRSPKQNMVGT